MTQLLSGLHWPSVVVSLIIVAALLLWILLRSRHIDIWIVDYLSTNRKRERAAKNISGPTHIMFCLADHYEPMWNQPSRDTENERVDRWLHELPRTLAGHVDADGESPRHSFFYPEEEYRPEHLAKLEALCGMGLGELEVHLHHDNDTSENLRHLLDTFVAKLHKDHGAFGLDPVSKMPAWSFIHGNWTLCNSDPNGLYCGVQDELQILRELGCYMDLTLPSAPSPTQTKKVNSIYYAEQKENQDKSHDSGINVRVGGKPSGDMLMLQGPLGFNWQDRKFGCIPRIENSDLSASAPWSAERIKLWLKSAVSVDGRPEWLFIKLYTHGAQEANMNEVLGDRRDALHTFLEQHYNDGENYALHYVSARESFNIIKAAEAGEQGNPGDYRDYQIPRPQNFKTSGIDQSLEANQ